MNDERDEFTCPICGDEESYSDAKLCNGCDRLVGVCCIHWRGPAHDEASGEYYCDECIEQPTEPEVNHD